MIKNKLNILLIIFCSIILYSCQSARDALEGKKRSDQNDEFLVQKKNPLAMPPDYEKLPTPGSQEISPKISSENSEVKDLLNIDESDSNIVDNDSSDNIESSIIEKIQ